jgi:hypothetical protein
MSSVQEALDTPVLQLLEIEQMELRQLAELKLKAEDELGQAAARNAKKKSDKVISLRLSPS